MVRNLDLLYRDQRKLAEAGEYIGNLERSILLLRVETNWALIHNTDLTICLRFEAKKKSKSHKCNEGESSSRKGPAGREKRTMKRGEEGETKKIRKDKKKIDKKQIQTKSENKF